MSPFATRTAAQIQFPSSNDRSSLRARTRAPTCEFKHRGRAGRVPSQSYACPSGVPAEAARTGHSRLSVGAVVPGLPEPGEHMTHSNSAHDAPDAETTAVTTDHSPTGASNSIGVKTDDCAPMLNSASQSTPRESTGRSVSPNSGSSSPLNYESTNSGAKTRRGATTPRQYAKPPVDSVGNFT